LKILSLLFGCWHKRLGFPISTIRGQRRIAAARQTGTYVVCLDCGREFPYDWQQMRVVSSSEQPEAPGTSLEAEAS
jgi:hypothetical protein